MENNVNNLKIPKMRTIKEAVAEIKAYDSGTAVTEYHIRQLALSGVLPRVKAGRKFLIKLDTLIEYLADPTAEKFKTSNYATDNGIY